MNETERLKMSINYPNIPYFVNYRENTEGFEVINSRNGKVLTTSKDLAALPEPEISDFTFADVGTFTDELFVEEPLWTSLTYLSTKDLQLSCHYHNLLIFLLHGVGSEMPLMAFRQVWINFRQRLAEVTGGQSLYDLESKNRWNDRVDRLYMPNWLKL